MYKTDFLKVKTQILETIFAQLPQTAKKVKLTIKFDDEQKLNTFKRLQAQRREEEDCASIDSAQDSQEDQGPLIDPLSGKEDLTPKQKVIKKQIGKRLRDQKIDISLEQGIIYKQFYEKSFQKIGQSSNVKIKIRAQKITFEGYEIQDIEDAMVDINDLRSHIEIEYIPKYGVEMSESVMIRKMLDDVGVKIFRILDKYYRWYDVSMKLSLEQQKRKRDEIKLALSQIDHTNHCLQFLYNIEQDVDLVKGSRNNDFLKLQQRFMHYRPLLQNLKGRMFEKQFKQKINGEASEDKLEAELSISQDAVVFHSIAKELLEMTIKEVKVQFQVYEYFYLTLDSDHPIQQAIRVLGSYEYEAVMKSQIAKPVFGQIEEVKEINYIHFTTNYQKVKQSIDRKLKASTHFGDYTPKQNVIFCIGFKRKYPERRLQYLCEMLQKLHSIWIGASYRISIGLDQQEEIEDNSISYEFNQTEKIFSISANQNNLETNVSILRNYVIRKKLQLKRNKQMNESEDNNISLSTISPSQFIQDSIILDQKSTTQDLNTSSILGEIKKDNLNNENQMNLQDQNEMCAQILKQYQTFFAETSKEYNEKYKDQTVKQNEIVQTDKRNRPMEDQLAKFTDGRFHVLKIKLNQKHKVEFYSGNQQKDEIVTVFISGKISPFVIPKGLVLKIEQELNQTFPIRFLTIKETISQSGYLINIKKKNIQTIHKGFKVKYGAEFQVAKAITYFKK